MLNSLNKVLSLITIALIAELKIYFSLVLLAPFAFYLYLFFASFPSIEMIYLSIVIFILTIVDLYIINMTSETLEDKVINKLFRLTSFYALFSITNSLLLLSYTPALYYLFTINRIFCMLLIITAYGVTKRIISIKKKTICLRCFYYNHESNNQSDIMGCAVQPSICQNYPQNTSQCIDYRLNK